MKIVQVCNDFSVKGGLERVVSTLLNYWSINRDVELLILSKKKSMAYHLNEQIGIKSYDSLFLDDSHLIKRYLNYFWSLIRFIFDLSNRGRGVIYIANGPWAALIMIIGRFFAFNKNSKIVVCDHNNPASFGKITNFLRGFFYFYSDGFIVLNKEQVINYEKFGKKVFLIRNPIENNRRKKEFFSGNKVIAIGRLCHQKGFDRLIEAWRLVVKNKKDAKLLIIGEGEEFDCLNNAINKFNLSKSIKITSFKKDLTSYYLRGDIYVMTSRNEGLPMVLLEAQNIGLPIVSFDCDYGPREIITCGVDGYLVRDGDLQAMAEKIVFLLNNIDVLKEFSKNAIENSKKFLVDEVGNDWECVFRFLKVGL